MRQQLGYIVRSKLTALSRGFIQLIKTPNNIQCGHSLIKNGRAILISQPLGEVIQSLSEDLFPSPDEEFSRDLFEILFFWWAKRATNNESQNIFDILTSISDLASTGYSDLPMLGSSPVGGEIVS
jgi:hypothetical protein